MSSSASAVPTVGPHLNLLLPEARDLGVPGAPGSVTGQLLAQLYRHPGGPEPILRANMVSSLDGAAWGTGGRSGSLGSPTDRMVFGAIRAQADLVLVGAGTVRAEGYGPLPEAARRAESTASDPALVIATRGGAQLGPRQDQLDRWERTHLLLPQAAVTPELRRRFGEERLIVCGEVEIDWAAAKVELGTRLGPRLLTEGGPGLLGTLSGLDLLDELCLTITPGMVSGTAGRILTGPDRRQDMILRHLLVGDGTLCGRWVRKPDGSEE